VAGATGNNFDVASATGDNSEAVAGNPFGNYPDTTGSSFDSSTAAGGASEAFAGFNGSVDSASAVGQHVESEAGFSANAADPANFDSASALGNLSTTTTGFIEAHAGGVGLVGGSDDSAFVVDPFGTLGSTADAGFGNNFDLAGALADNLAATATGSNFFVDILPSLF
jgi:hypothetical protein